MCPRLCKYLLSALSLFLAGCFEDKDNQPVDVWVSVDSQKYFVDRVAEEWVRVEVLSEGIRELEKVDFSSELLERLDAADVYLGVGLPVEQRLFKQLNNAGSDLRQLQLIGLEDDRYHEHFEGCIHEAVDTFQWLDPVEMMAYSVRVYQALSDHRPLRTLYFKERADRLLVALERLDQELQAQLAPYIGRSLLVDGRLQLDAFASRYGLDLVDLEDLLRHETRGAVGSALAEFGAVLVSDKSSAGIDNSRSHLSDLQIVEIDVLSGDYFEMMRTLANVCVEILDR